MESLEDGPDIRTCVGPRTYVDLRRGLFRDEIRVWKDVWPALGGLIGRKRVRHRDVEREYAAIVDVVTAAYAPRES